MDDQALNIAGARLGGFTQGAGLEERGAGRVLLLDGPGARPFRTLVERWARAVDRPFEDVERDLGSERFGTGGPQVLVIDQLEELITDCSDPEERELFVRAVSGAGAATWPRIVLGLRADFYGRCMRDARLARMLPADAGSSTPCPSGGSSGPKERAVPAP
ncbi:hypothetical protein GCM10010206_17990 [Streptomyces cinerochromogenes]|nr:hypothetical protein [Streptomyces cinerochromogenes]GGS56426.1 hypothetical protein GCM10010206_17990 [Streptomyces cinerochromogenes]